MEQFQGYFRQSWVKRWVRGGRCGVRVFFLMLFFFSWGVSEGVSSEGGVEDGKMGEKGAGFQKGQKGQKNREFFRNQGEGKGNKGKSGDGRLRGEFGGEKRGKNGKGGKGGKQGRALPLHDPRFREMVKLAGLKDEEFEVKFQQWVDSRGIQEGREHEAMKRRMEGFRRKLRMTALTFARERGFRFSEGAGEQEFIKQYWKKRMEVEDILMREMEPRRQELLEGMAEELGREVSQNEGDGNS